MLATRAASPASRPAHAVEAVNVRSDSPGDRPHRRAIECLKSDTDRIQVSTAPGPDGIVRRIEVRAREGNTNWVVFALTNNSDEQIDRLIVVPHYRMVGSGLIWPDLGLSRVAGITPSTGDRPVRQESTTSDIFRVTLDPGTVVTFVAELRTDKLPQLYLWEPEAYKDKVNSFTLYQGIVIGIAGLLALVLTILFVVKGSRHVPGRRRARLGGSHLYRHRLRILGQGVRHVGRRRARLARLRRGDPVGDAAGFPVRLSESQSRWHVRYAHITIAWLAVLGRPDRASLLFDPAGRRRHRAHVARSASRCLASRCSSTSRRTVMTAPCC